MHYEKATEIYRILFKAVDHSMKVYAAVTVLRHGAWTAYIGIMENPKSSNIGLGKNAVVWTVKDGEYVDNQLAIGLFPQFDPKLCLDMRGERAPRLGVPT